MKKNLFYRILILSLVLLAVGLPATAQKKKSSRSYKWGVGIKAGDPLGVSIKNYFGGNKGLELIVGRSYYWGNYNYDYRFYHDNRYKGRGYYYYRSYGYSTPIAFQFRYLVHKDIKELSGLKWYVGVGAQLRYGYYYYDFRDEFGRWYAERVTDLGIGPDIIGGLEYTFDDVPISIALDLNLYMEIVDRPFLFLVQGGLAARYNF